MGELTRIKLPTRELLFSIRNEIELPQFKDAKIREITDSDTYVKATYFNNNDVVRIAHIYSSSNHYIIIEEDENDSQVMISKKIDILFPYLLSITGESLIAKEVLDIPANVFLGLVTSISRDEIIEFLYKNTHLSKNISEKLILDLNNIKLQEHFVAYDKQQSKTGYIRFLKGKNIWRISPSNIQGNILIKLIDHSTYIDSVTKFFKEMVNETR